MLSAETQGISNWLLRKAATRATGQLLDPQKRSSSLKPRAKCSRLGDSRDRIGSDQHESPTNSSARDHSPYQNRRNTHRNKLRIPPYRAPEPPNQPQNSQAKNTPKRHTTIPRIPGAQQAENRTSYRRRELSPPPIRTSSATPPDDPTPPPAIPLPLSCLSCPNPSPLVVCAIIKYLLREK
jgi:hypothetical protein